MEKFKTIMWIIGGVLVAYVLLIAGWPVLTVIISSSSAEVATHNLTPYVAAKEGLDYTPFVIFLSPAVIGIGAIVYVLKWGKND